MRRITCLAASVLLAGATLAQEATSNPRTPESPRITSVDFRGGTIEAYIEHLMRSVEEGASINVIVSEEASDVPVPPLALRAVTADAAITALESLVSNESVRLGIEEIREGGNPLWIISARHITRGAPSGVRQTVVYSLVNIIHQDDAPEEANTASFSDDDALGAIEAALSVAADGRSDAPTMKFHEASSLLIVNGTPGQIHAVQQVVSEMQRSVEARRVIFENSMARRKQSDLATQFGVQSIQDAHRSYQEKVAQLDDARLHLSQLKAELADMRAVYDATRTQMQMLEDQVAMLHRKNMELETQLRAK